MTLDIGAVRERFPALGMTDNGRRRYHFDNPAGTQVPEDVANAVREAMFTAASNQGGPFVTSVQSDRTVEAARRAMADFLNAPSPDCIAFGQNMTSLTYHLAHALESRIGPGDDIIVTRLDHDANIWPWARLAERTGATVIWLSFDPDTGELETEHLDTLLGARTKLVAVGYASNLLGTINPVGEIVEKARSAGALSFIDAVHYAPHGAIDVQDIGCDFLVCSSYKFFGPHQGILYGRYDLLEDLQPDRLRPAPSDAPGKWETGTQNHAGLAGITAAIDYLASLAPAEITRSRRARLTAAMAEIMAYEAQLTQQLIDGLSQVPGLTIRGITNPNRFDRRCATTSFTLEGRHPDDVTRELANRNIFAWGGHSYAVEAVNHLGLTDAGGVIRVGPVHYNTAEEIDDLVRAIDEIARA